MTEQPDHGCGVDVNRNRLHGKLKTIKQLEGNLKVVSTLARAKVPGYSAKLQNIESTIQSLRSNIYIEPFAVDGSGV